MTNSAKRVWSWKQCVTHDLPKDAARFRELRAGGPISLESYDKFSDDRERAALPNYSRKRPILESGSR